MEIPGFFRFSDREAGDKNMAVPYIGIGGKIAYCVLVYALCTTRLIGVGFHGYVRI